MEATGTSLIIPQMGVFYAMFGPWVELALRVWVGAVLVPYALRSSFGFFSDTGVPVQSVRGTAEYLTQYGWHPGVLWAWLSTINNLVGGVMLALGLFTRPVALTSCVLLFLSACHHLRRDGYFANQNGFEHYGLWSLGALYFVIHGGGVYSLDHLIGWEF
ncbi:MAG: DoxX family protein [Alphaproteobacteria bacterium]|nr:DoxX family protein [Alphaproteobacteria bacterium]MCZ6764938.1 DoxX family protein [Alphaproteobacteria bacterium]